MDCNIKNTLGLAVLYQPEVLSAPLGSPNCLQASSWCWKTKIVSGTLLLGMPLHTMVGWSLVMESQRWRYHCVTDRDGHGQIADGGGNSLVGRLMFPRPLGSQLSSCDDYGQICCALSAELPGYAQDAGIQRHQYP